MNERASERTNGRRGPRERSEQCGEQASESMVRAKERADELVVSRNFTYIDFSVSTQSGAAQSKRSKKRPMYHPSLTLSQKRRLCLRHRMRVAMAVGALNRRLALSGVTLIVVTINIALSLHIAPLLKSAIHGALHDG